MKNFSEINQSDTAKRKLKNIAKDNNLPEDFVTILFNYNWDLDPLYKNEATGWVRNEQLKQVNEKQFNNDLSVLINHLKIEGKISFKSEFIAEQLFSIHNSINQNNIEDKVLIAG